MRWGTAVILLNWNGWRDTVECVSSLLQGECQNFFVVICDNASTDESWAEINHWCEANVAGNWVTWKAGEPWTGFGKVVLIQTESNLGFAGGCNVGMRFALQYTGCEYVWLLNNDTVVSPEALTWQLRRMQEDPHLGLLGSTLVFHDRPDVVQCFGGYGFNFWTGRVRPFAFPPDPEHPPGVKTVEEQMRYVSGASTFTSRAFIETVGLLNEQYFLYFEEIDWAVRGSAFRMSYCPESVIYHKEGRSIGSAQSAQQRSRQSELWLTRNRLLFTRTYFPQRLPVALLWVLLVALFRACTGSFTLATTLLRGSWSGIRASIRPLPSLGEWRQRSGAPGEGTSIALGARQSSTISMDTSRSHQDKTHG